MIIRDYLKEVRGFSKRMIKVVKFDGGGIIVNDTPVTVRFRLKAGDCLEILLPEEVRGSFMKTEDIDLTIVYEDDDVLVLEKPPGIATIPSLHHPSGTIANGLLGYYEKKNIQYTIHVVTRLDRDTSGLLLIAKHRYSHSLLSRDQRNGLVNRSYYAMIEGKLTQKEGTINAPIGRDPTSIIQRKVTADGKHAVTHYQVELENSSYTLVHVKLETGRTHQIRVHFAFIKHPLVGDSLYGGMTETLNRQALHCKSLSFTHPTTNERLTFHSKLPDDISRLL
ncbi:RluA family pseudouridine synthase [Terrihalobacillus insolitus]|uniref:RluA family pseudouridine synthase n=1 Tax=Terrihalobacillus insolitus TaxID=2950438 RepID=UPI0023427DC6|nr:RluA family pseudouridine synthase [Terrihalobacillus insolitus]MDC3413667.1 RluA family pseudouridine synthase [Terrihalobacillus insolitus]